MLQGIFDVLTAIGDFFASIIDFVGGLIDGLIQFVTSLGSIAGDVTSLMGGLPAYLLAGILSLIAIMVVLRVVGRD